jgi:uncharacterized Fe-S cluster protein YjdI
MSEKEIIKEYNTEGITVIWKPRQCIHSEVCVKTLPGVYKPKEKPWIIPENASVSDLKSQIDLCPSGALSYKLVNGHDNQNKSNENMSNKVEVLPNGPLMVHGELEITLADGSKETKSKPTAFCRCGASGNKPYCDGGHRAAGFKDA